MSTTDIIRKYNEQLAGLKRGRKFATGMQGMVIDDMIKIVEGFISDLVYIQTKMPSINPIERGHFNESPEGLKEIGLEEWQRGFSHYCVYARDSKQVRRDGKTFDLDLFDVQNFDNKKMGWAIMHDWFDQEKGKNRPVAITRFCRYGLDEDWKSFESRFAAQFAGDNS